MKALSHTQALLICVVLWTWGAVVVSGGPSRQKTWNCSDEDGSNHRLGREIDYMRPCFNARWDASRTYGESKETCCRDYESYCLSQKLYIKYCNLVEKESEFLMNQRNVTHDCAQLYGIQVSTAYCETIVSKKPLQKSCAGYFPCDPTKKIPLPKVNIDFSAPGRGDDPHFPIGHKPIELKPPTPAPVKYSTDNAQPPKPQTGNAISIHISVVMSVTLALVVIIVNII